MSSVFKPIRKLQDKSTPGFLKFTQKADIGRSLGDMANPKLPTIDIPSAPTIDTAQQNRQQQDRLRRRRGVLANVFGGAGAGSGGAGSTLLGGG